MTGPYAAASGLFESRSFYCLSPNRESLWKWNIPFSDSEACRVRSWQGDSTQRVRQHAACEEVVCHPWHGLWPERVALEHRASGAWCRGCVDKQQCLHVPLCPVFWRQCWDRGKECVITWWSPGIQDLDGVCGWWTLSNMILMFVLKMLGAVVCCGS